MTAAPVEANVVLTADNSNYDQAMGNSAQTTSQLSSSIDTLTSKVSKMTRTAGKSLIGIAAADVALIGGATKAWNDYEKQMERLRSQAAVLSRTQDQQNKVMKDYTTSVRSLRSEFGTTTTEAAKLVETLSKVTNIRQTRDLQDLAKVFVQMSGATGESSEGLASSLTNLQKVMGTPINERNSRRYADTFTYLAAQTNTSAQGLIDFTAQLAPVAESLGMNTKEVAGFATAFTQAGQEGGAAATAFTKVTSDMLRSIQSGSPELKTYANIVGMTGEQFSKLAKDDSAEAVLRVFEALSRNTKTASNDLNRLGLDGPRTIRAITSLTNQPGGIRAALGLAEDPAARGATARGYEAAMEGISDNLGKLREDMKQTAEAFASYLAPMIESFVTGLERAGSIVQNITEGPFGELISMIAGIVAPLAGGAGALLLFAGALVKVAGAFTALRSSAAYGLREGFTGRGAPLTRTGTDAAGRSIFGPMGGGPLGTRGEQLAERGTWVQRGLYNAGAVAGQGLGAFRRGGAVPDSWQQTREALSRRIPWTEQYQRPTPGTMRSPLSYVAGGLGRGIDQFLTPTFDAMRYADPTKRTQWAAREAPWASLGQRSGLVRSMGEVGLAETQMVAQRAEYSKVRADPLMTDQAREARLTELRQIHRETAERRNAAQAQESASRQVIASQQRLTRENESTAVGGAKLGESLRKLGTNVGGGILGGARQGAGAFMSSSLAMPAMGMASMAALSGLGVQSNAAMMGSMGLMMGNPAIAAGMAGVGAILDARAQYRNFQGIQRTRGEATRQGIPSEMLAANQAAIAEFAPYQTQQERSHWERLTHPGDLPGNIVRGIGDAFQVVTGGGDPYKTRQAEAEAARTQTRDLAGAISSLTEAQGKPLGSLDLTSDRDRAKLDQAITDLAPAMDELDISTQEITKAFASRNTVEGARAWSQMVSDLTTPGQATGMWDRLRTTDAGAALLGDRTMRRSLQLEGDIALAYDATNKVFTSMRDQGMSYLDIVRSTEKAQAEIGVEGGPEYSRLAAFSQKAQYALQMQAPQMGRVGAVQSQLALTQAVLGTKPTTETDAAEREAQKQAAAQAIASQDAYFRQMLLAQQAFERSRTRAQDDFNLQRQYQEYDYDLQRTRAEDNFNRMRARATADYHRGLTRAWSDFHLQRQRQEDDYNHQLEVQAKQRVIAMNLYQRVETQRTSAATWLSANSNDIIDRMRTQIADLRKLRQMGISDDAIQMYNLASPENQQQLARLVAEMTPQLTRRFNRQAGTLQRLSGRLGQDPGNLEAAEAERNFRLSRERGMEDMNRAMARQNRDFRRGLHQQREDFNIMMGQQAEDFETQQHRQLRQYNTTMDRAAEDMAHMADEVLGSIEDVLVKSSKKLTGSAQEQARTAVKAFRDLKKDTTPEAVALMQELSEVFGFDYKNPLKGGGGGTPDRSTSSTGGYPGAGANTTAQTPIYYAGGYGGPSNGMPRAEGGMVPGWTPGRDIYNVHLSGGEAIMRPEWARAVGPQIIDAMNHQAKHGGFAAGGVFWPVPGHRTGTYPGHDGVDINRGSGSDDLGDPIRAFRSGQIVYVGTGRGYGEAIFEATRAGTVVYGHTSSQNVHAGQMVNAGQLIGRVGSTGNSSAPHLHFGIPGGTTAQALALLNGAILGGFAGGDFGAMGPRKSMSDIVKDLYPKAEAAAANMKGVHPLFPGDISKVLNRFVRRKYRQLDRRFGLTGPGTLDIGREPSGHLGNEQIVHTGANRMGWGDQWGPLRQIVMHESGFSNTAQNPTSTAYGMFQFLDSTWPSYGVRKTSDPWKQTQAGLRYIKERYNDPRGAWRFWKEHNWYGDGAMFDAPNTIGVGEKGPEAVIPLNDKGGEFLARSIGLTTAQMGGGGVSVSNYRIDRSTNFTGPITVAANDPNELLAKLQARQRVRALSRPALTGSAA